MRVILGVVVAASVGLRALATLLAYLVLNAAYSLRLKRVAVVADRSGETDPEAHDA